jgi:hypothetical protein
MGEKRRAQVWLVALGAVTGFLVGVAVGGWAVPIGAVLGAAAGGAAAAVLGGLRRLRDAKGRGLRPSRRTPGPTAG